MSYRKNSPEFRRKSEVSSLSECIEELLNAYKLKGKYNQTNIVASWAKVMGKSVATRTDKVFIKDQKLFVKLNSATLKHQLNTARHKVIELLNKECGEGIITDVVFL